MIYFDEKIYICSTFLKIRERVHGRQEMKAKQREQIFEIIVYKIGNKMYNSDLQKNKPPKLTSQFRFGSAPRHQKLPLERVLRHILALPPCCVYSYPSTLKTGKMWKSYLLRTLVAALLLPLTNYVQNVLKITEKKCSHMVT